MQWVESEGRLERLVVLGKWAFVHLGARKEASDAFGVHDERAHAEGGRFIVLVIGDVSADPLLAVPRDDLAGWIKRLAVYVARRTVIQNPTVIGPCPRPA